MKSDNVKVTNKKEIVIYYIEKIDFRDIINIYYLCYSFIIIRNIEKKEIDY
jgi:hypothetical protein